MLDKLAVPVSQDLKEVVSQALLDKTEAPVSQDHKAVVSLDQKVVLDKQEVLDSLDLKVVFMFICCHHFGNRIYQVITNSFYNFTCSIYVIFSQKSF